MLKYAFYFWLLFKLPYTWIMMLWTRTHFVIDMGSGIACGIIAVQLGEKISVYLDVSINGLKAQSRDLVFYTVCPSCGWAN